jgi:hypothetical protein
MNTGRLQMCGFSIWKFGLLCLSIVAGLSGCALTPKSAEAQKQSSSLLLSQLADVEARLDHPAAPATKHIYLGSAQHSQSLVFQRDVLSMLARLKRLNPDTYSILLSNQLETHNLQYPFATVANLQQVFDALANWSRKYPLALTLLISTHGSPDVLSVNIGNQYFQPVRSLQLKPWLDQLHPRTKVTIMLSACYSGSFADNLSGPNRVVITAAAADRNSFGCNYREENTWFIGQLLTQMEPHKNWSEVFLATRAGVELKEQAQKMQPASNPQLRSPIGLQKMTLAQWFLN